MSFTVIELGFSCADGDVRLVGGKYPHEGRVEVCFNNQFGTVCDDHWDSNDANVVCNQLGYHNKGNISLLNNYITLYWIGALALHEATYGEGIGPVHLDDTECIGNETNITHCLHKTTTNCQHNEDAAIVCKRKIKQKKLSMLLKYNIVYEDTITMYYCKYYVYYVALVPACKDGAVRLVNGRLSSEGRVEICHNGVWGTVCHDHWDDKDAGIVCKQLGYGSEGRYHCI